MPSTYSDNLRIQLMQTGEKTGQWGAITNVNVGQLVEQALTYQSTIPVSDSGAPTPLTSVDGTATGDTARSLYIKLTGALTATRTVTTPQYKHLYIVENATTGGQSISFITTAVGSVGITIPNGATALLYCDGTNVVSASSYFTSIVNPAITGGSINNTTIGGTTPSSGIFTNGSAQTWNVTTGGTLNGVSLTNATGSFTSGTYTTITINGGTINDTIIGNVTPTYGIFTTVSATSLTSGRIPYTSTSGLLLDSGNLTFDGTTIGLAAGTPTGITYLNASRKLTSGTVLTFDGTNLAMTSQTANGLAYFNGSKVLSTSATVTFNGTSLTFTGDTALGIAYLNGSNVLSYGSNFTYDGTNASIGGAINASYKLNVIGALYATSFTTTSVNASSLILNGSSSGTTTVQPSAVASGTLTLPAATDTLVARATTDTLTNKRIDPRVVSTATATSVTPSIATADVYAFTALASGLTIDAPTGTPVDGDKLIFRILDNGTARALTWNATYTAIGAPIPTTTVINKTVYVGCMYNANNTRWDVIAVTQQV